MRNGIVFAGIYLLLALMLVLSSMLPTARAEEKRNGETDTASARSETENEETFAAETPAQTGEPETEAPYKEQTILSVFDAKNGKEEKMPLEEYIAHAVMAEMPYTAPSEALKAQAVAARTYCLYRLANGQAHGDTEAYLCTDYAHCMAYISDEDAAVRWGEDTAEEVRRTIREAVRATEGQYLASGGKPIAALFHSSSFKATENAENVWGHAYPCLVSVPTYEEDEKSVVKVPEEKLRALLERKGKPVFSSLLFEEAPSLVLNGTGRADRLRAFGYEIDAVLLRGELGLRSTRFELSEEDGAFVFTCHGYGHGVGMSQAGAERLAENGANYKEILAYYYVGSELVFP